MSVTVSLSRDVLVAKGACVEGIAFFDAVADGAAEVVVEWSPLAWLWLPWSGWLFHRGLVQIGSAHV